MKTLLRFTLYTTIIYLTISTLNPALAAVNLNGGEPRTVRLIYYLPNDRPYRAEVVQQMKTDILLVQDFYAEEMRLHGHGNITFRVETDPQGEPMVHRVDGEHPDSHYIGKDSLEIYNIIAQRFDVEVNVYAVLLDNSKGVAARGGRRGKNGGFALVDNDSEWITLAHELGHAFGLQHDFSNYAYLMSYGSRRTQLSACSAEYLSVHPYFNPNVHPEDRCPTVELISPQIYPAEAKNVPIKLKMNDAEGLHQVILFVTTQTFLPAAGFLEVKACQGLGGETDTIVEFDYDGVTPSDSLTSLSTPTRHPIAITAIDVNGNNSFYFFDLESDSPESYIVDDPFDLYSGINLEGRSLASVLSEDPDIRRLVGLGLDFKNIRDLVEIVSALSDMPNLKRLDLDGNLISDLSPMASLTNLTELRLGQNNISDLSPLSGLTNLTELYLSNNSISDIFPVSSLVNLTELYLSSNSIPDLSPLSGLTNLTELYLGFNSISDLSPLSGLTDLTQLNLSSNNISDLSPLSDLNRLDGLHLSGNLISDLSPLSGLVNLTELNLSSNNISDLSPVASLTNLTELNLGYTNISDLSPVSGLTDLTDLRLYGNSISDLSPVVGLTDLTDLWLDHNSISDLSPVSGLTDLTYLSLSYNSISDLSPLAANTGLGTGDEVQLHNNPLSYISIKTHIPTLQGRGVKVYFDDRASPALLKVSGDHQKGTAATALANPFVVEVQNSDGTGLAGISVTFAVTAGNGTLSATDTTTDADGRAESTLTLGPNLGTNTISASVNQFIRFPQPDGSGTGYTVQWQVTFNALADTKSLLVVADLNGDGSVNILDLVLIASSLGQSGQNDADVNGDSVVSILDLVLAAGMFDNAVAAPSGQPQVPETLTTVKVQGWLASARNLEVRNPIMKRGFMVLEQLLVSLTPTETKLLTSYPNPFNPETWIPYRLAEDAFVTLTIYDIAGQVIRTLDAGHRIASAYENRSKAIYWDGRNDVGERVASGVYFYNLAAGDYSATRRMVILK